PRLTLVPYTTLFRSPSISISGGTRGQRLWRLSLPPALVLIHRTVRPRQPSLALKYSGAAARISAGGPVCSPRPSQTRVWLPKPRSEEHTSELQSREN